MYYIRSRQCMHRVHHRTRRVAKARGALRLDALHAGRVARADQRERAARKPTARRTRTRGGAERRVGKRFKCFQSYLRLKLSFINSPHSGEHYMEPHTGQVSFGATAYWQLLSDAAHKQVYSFNADYRCGYRWQIVLFLIIYKLQLKVHIN